MGEKGKEKKAESKAVAMDIDMQEVEAKIEEEKKLSDPRVAAFRKICENVELIQKGVYSRANHYIHRALRSTGTFRREMTSAALEEALERFVPKDREFYALLLDAISFVKSSRMEQEDSAWLGEEIEREKKEKAEKEAREAEEQAKKEKKKAEDAAKKHKDETDEQKTKREAEEAKIKTQEAVEKAKKDAEAKQKEQDRITGSQPEVDMYLHMLVLLHLIDNHHKQKAHAVSCVAISKLREATYNRRTLDLISARQYYFFGLTAELVDQLAAIRSTLLELHRTVCLRHDEPGQAVLANCILRNYLHYNLYSNADKFRLNISLPESRTNNEHARYLYYLGKIQAMQLHYSEANRCLMQASSKGPQVGALGFRQAVAKLTVIVQLLMGDIPERSLFRQPDLKRSLKPYFLLTQTVRVGDLSEFTKVMNTHKDRFVQDRIYTLINRLRHNVIKTGLRKINLSYSRISIRDVCEKLHLETVDDAEYIIAKAIHDGVIDAVIDKEKEYVYSKETLDHYSTSEPQQAFNQRIQFCLDVHNGAVTALRFPESSLKSENNVDSDYDDDFD